MDLWTRGPSASKTVEPRWTRESLQGSVHCQPKANARPGAPRSSTKQRSGAAAGGRAPLVGCKNFAPVKHGKTQKEKIFVVGKGKNETFFLRVFHFGPMAVGE